MPDERDVTELVDVFGLLSDPGRLRLLVALLEAMLAREFGIAAVPPLR